ncbi:MAG: thiamine-phosphate pyrophosphorylase [Endomicrobia bacterium]|nr:thiamine-phosphate pyrophosphorylase [Endomicrobiia bacterium]MCX7941140.1 thiamine-phosphate pyrophosphorylase [Endomicrobiia bacterium]MDW8055286.1 thiamine-phosphate pyrophosphorylase [Elusimicrobiota bacterium]
MKKEILRILDANLNRITEGLRVIEDTLRFVFNEDKIYKQLRQIRHKIVRIFIEFYPTMIFGRSSDSDPGRTAKEKKYKNINEIVVSNFHRVTESLRVLEEIAKLQCVKKVAEVKNLRYKVYEIEKEVVKKFLK